MWIYTWFNSSFIVNQCKTLQHIYVYGPCSWQSVGLLEKYDGLWELVGGLLH